MPYTVIAHITSNDPQKSALWFQTFLAVDKGVPSTIEHDGVTVIVVADDHRAVRFTR